MKGVGADDDVPSVGVDPYLGDPTAVCVEEVLHEVAGDVDLVPIDAPGGRDGTGQGFEKPRLAPEPETIEFLPRLGSPGYCPLRSPAPVLAGHRCVHRGEVVEAMTTTAMVRTPSKRHDFPALARQIVADDRAVTVLVGLLAAEQADRLPGSQFGESPGALGGLAGDQVAKGLHFRVLRVRVAQLLEPLVSDLGVPERLFDPLVERLGLHVHPHAGPVGIDPDVGHDLDAVLLQRLEELFPGLAAVADGEDGSLGAHDGLGAPGPRQDFRSRARTECRSDGSRTRCRFAANHS